MHFWYRAFSCWNFSCCLAVACISKHTGSWNRYSDPNLIWAMVKMSSDIDLFHNFIVSINCSEPEIVIYKQISGYNNRNPTRKTICQVTIFRLSTSKWAAGPAKSNGCQIAKSYTWRFMWQFRVHMFKEHVGYNEFIYHFKYTFCCLCFFFQKTWPNKITTHWRSSCTTIQRQPVGTAQQEGPFPNRSDGKSASFGSQHHVALGLWRKHQETWTKNTLQNVIEWLYSIQMGWKFVSIQVYPSLFFTFCLKQYWITYWNKKCCVLPCFPTELILCLPCRRLELLKPSISITSRTNWPACMSVFSTKWLTSLDISI